MADEKKDQGRTGRDHGTQRSVNKDGYGPGFSEGREPIKVLDTIPPPPPPDSEKKK